MNAGLGGAWGGNATLGGYGSQPAYGYSNQGFGGYGGYWKQQPVACPPSPNSLLGGYGGAGFVTPGIVGPAYGYQQTGAISPYGVSQVGISQYNGASQYGNGSVSQYNGVSQYNNGVSQYGAYGC